MPAQTNASGEKFCSSCFKYRPADEVKLVPSSNGRQNILRCSTCDEARQKAAAARLAATKTVKKVKKTNTAA